MLRTFARMTKAMDRNTAACLKELRDLGCPVFIRDEDPQEHGAQFFISAVGLSDEEAACVPNLDRDEVWANYYELDYPWINPLVEKVTAKHEMRIEWVNADMLGIYQD